MNANEFYNGPKNPVKKFTSVICHLRSSEFLFYPKDNKRDFLCDVLHHQKRDYIFSKKQGFRTRKNMEKNPA